MEDIIDKLEVEVKVMQEVKQRDEQLIQYSSYYLEIWLRKLEILKEIDMEW